MLDVWVLSHYGAHLSSYLPFITSALHSREQLQWVGDPGALAVALAKLLAATAIVCGALRALAEIATRVSFARLAPAPARALVLAATCSYVAMVLAAFPAQRLLAAPELRKRVVMSLPYGTDWSLSRAVAHASHDLQLLGIVPWPWRSAELTEVMIHNPASNPRSAEGWQLENASGQRATLHGEIAAGATRHFELERAHFALSRQQDSVTLVAPAGGVRSRVAYHDEDMMRGAVLWNSLQSSDSETALAQIGEVAQGAYADAFSRIVAGRPATLVPAAQLPRADAPNVILLVRRELPARNREPRPARTPCRARSTRPARAAPLLGEQLVAPRTLLAALLATAARLRRRARRRTPAGGGRSVPPARLSQRVREQWRESKRGSAWISSSASASSTA